MRDCRLASETARILRLSVAAVSHVASALAAATADSHRRTVAKRGFWRERKQIQKGGVALQWGSQTELLEPPPHLPFSRNGGGKR